MSEKKYLYLAGAIIAGLLLTVGVAKGMGGFKLGGQGEAKVNSPLPTTPPRPVVPEAKPGDYRVRVLNGTLAEGEAGRLAEKLSGLGYEVVEKKNATSAGFTTTRLRAYSDVSAKIIESLKATLEETYSAVGIESLASDSGGVRLEIIIGAKKSS